jgi:hypothetical protein
VNGPGCEHLRVLPDRTTLCTFGGSPRKVDVPDPLLANRRCKHAEKILCGESYSVSSCYLRGLLPRKTSQVPRPTKRPMSHAAMTQRTGSAQQVMHHPQSGPVPE